MNDVPRSLADVRREIELVDRLGGSLERLAEILGCSTAALLALRKVDEREAGEIESLLRREHGVEKGR